MPSVDEIENLSTAFLRMSKMASQAVNKSIEEEIYTPAFEARTLFVAQAVCSAVAIPFILVSSFFMMLWKLVHGEDQEAVYAIGAGVLFSGYHFCTIFASLVAASTSMEWSSKTLDWFQFEQKKTYQTT